MDAVAAYFDAERAESVLFVAVGLLAIGVAALGWRRAAFWRGVAWPLAAVALIQIAVGAAVWLRSPHDRERVQRIVASDRPRVAADEIPRMQAVMRNFVVYRGVEAALLAAGVVLAATAARGSVRQGIGAGLAAQAGFMLLLDHVAEQRGEAYLAWLRGLA